MKRHILLAELHADLFSRHASPLEVCVFVAVDERGERCYVRRGWLSMQRRTEKKEAWWPKCAAHRPVYDSALFFEISMHVYVVPTIPWYRTDLVFKKKHGNLSLIHI